MHERRNAYTLMELVLVLAVLLVTASMVLPSMEAMFGHSRLTAATDQVRAALLLARTRSVIEGRPYRFAILPNTGSYRIAPDAHEYWSTTQQQAHPVPDQPEAAAPPLLVEETLPRQVRIATTDADTPRIPSSEPEEDTDKPARDIPPERWQAVAVFKPDGRAREDVKLVLQMKGARSVLLKLRALTKVTTLQTLPLRKKDS